MWGFIMLNEDVLTSASHLGHTDTNIHLLMSHAAAKTLLQVRGTTEPAGPDVFRQAQGGQPSMLYTVLQLLNPPFDLNMCTITRLKGTVARDCRPLVFLNNGPNMGPLFTS
jgi:hypothetical protein